MNRTLSSRGRNARRGRGDPTIADVAAQAGVSSMTVSRVVNGGANVLPATRAKVQAAIEALGHIPHAAARSLAGGQQCRVALIHNNPSAAYLNELLVGSLIEAAACDVELTVEPFAMCAADALDGQVAALVKRLCQRRIDAVILPPPLCENDVLLAALQAAALPMVHIANAKPSPFAHAVTIDDRQAAHAMTARLVQLGHRRIGFVTGDRNQSASMLRQQGYEQALVEAGIPPDPTLIAQGDFSYRSGLTAAEILLSLTPRPTAIFASNDDMAAAAVAVAHRRGIDVPGGVSICGFDDSAMATTIWPEITTINQPIVAMAQKAVRLLADVVRRRDVVTEPLHLMLDFALVVRVSDGPPPQIA